jgi:hypothetical protein
MGIQADLARSNACQGSFGWAFPSTYLNDVEVDASECRGKRSHLVVMACGRYRDTYWCERAHGTSGRVHGGKHANPYAVRLENSSEGAPARRRVSVDRSTSFPSLQHPHYQSTVFPSFSSFSNHPRPLLPCRYCGQCLSF